MLPHAKAALPYGPLPAAYDPVRCVVSQWGKREHLVSGILRNEGTSTPRSAGAAILGPCAYTVILSERSESKDLSIYGRERFFASLRMTAKAVSKALPTGELASAARLRGDTVHLQATVLPVSF